MATLTQSPPKRIPRSRLNIHPADWPAPCVACETIIRRGEPLVFASGHKERWCLRCAAALPGEIKPARAYAARFGDDARAVALRATATRATRPGGRWREHVPDPADLCARRVRIRRGAVVLSDTSPRAAPTRTCRAQVVKVYEVLAANPSARTPTTLRWAGAGGYLREVSINDIEQLVE